ncbi:cobalamin biosynthesis protein [Bradyrhizobium sp. dw_78]|uniref:cobalamin biosynthesis protein n=1 Tax=Bradyrhizobium sp. dw_78 TaxID=2719793 RepID=UPI001BD57F04|nr:cobalamin biosynthesis protein [Bradyrhizobium sp. dw_78]
MSRLVIGVGFRDRANAQSISEVLASVASRSAMSGMETVLVVPEDKAAHPGLRAAAQAMQLRIETVTADAMDTDDIRIITRSQQVKKYRGVDSVCEAAALAAAGAGARLVVTRVVSRDRFATAAAAITEDATP